MNEKIVYSFIEFIRLNFQYSQDDLSKIKYALQMFLYEAEKFIILIIIFTVLGKTKEFIFSTIILFSIRPFAGGLHFYKFSTCFIFTLLFYINSILFLPLLTLNLTSAFVILNISLILNIISAPISSKYRPKRDTKTNNKFKIISTIIIFIHIINILFVSKSFQSCSCYLWVIALQSAQLIFAKEMLHYEKRTKTI